MSDGHDAPAWPDDAIEVGRIGGAWGVKGAVRVQPHAGRPEALLSSRRWFLRLPAVPGPTGRPATDRPARVTQVRTQGDAVVASLDGLADRDQAEALKGAAVFVSRASFPTPQAGEYYWVDLIGLDVVNREGLRLGRVAELIDTGAHSVLVVDDDGASPAARRLIPFVAAYIDDVDLPGRSVRVDWGLDY